MEDTNLLYRGGAAGLTFAQEAAAGFLGQGGIAQTGWRERAAAIHHAFVARRLSPGGCADRSLVGRYPALSPRRNPDREARGCPLGNVEFL